MVDISNKRTSTKLIYVCAVAYFVSYVTRINFAAVITEIVSDGDITKPLAGLVTTLGFFTYGIGQLISGWLGDRINPKRLMAYGFAVTSLMNILIPFCPNGKWMCVVWAINGLAQSFMWPPMIKIMRTALDINTFNKGCVTASCASTVATILIYLVSPIVIKLFSWKAVFYISAFVGAAMVFVWYFSVTAIEKTLGLSYVLHSSENSGKRGKIPLAPFIFVMVLIAILLQGSLRDGVTTWLPTLVSEKFKLNSEISILSGVAVPVLSFVSLQATSVFYNKMKKKPFVCSSILFAAAAVCIALLAVFKSQSAIMTVVLLGVAVASMHGINLILICFLPAIYTDGDNISTLSGLLNFATYVGSALSTYVFAILSEKSGWSATVMLWIIISVLGAVICMLCKLKKNNVKK